LGVAAFFAFVFVAGVASRRGRLAVRVGVTGVMATDVVAGVVGSVVVASAPVAMVVLEMIHELRKNRSGSSLGLRQAAWRRSKCSRRRSFQGHVHWAGGDRVA